MDDVAVGFIAGGTVTTKWMFSLLGLPLKVIGVISGPALFEGRNELVQKFLTETDKDYLFMVDTDILFYRQDVERLRAHERPVASGLYVADNGLLLAGTFTEGERCSTILSIPEKPTEVEWAGAGFMLIHRSVLEEIGSNWFDHVNRTKADGSVAQIGEDVSFCWRMLENGHKILLDPSVQVGHIKTQIYYPEDSVSLVPTPTGRRE